MDLTTDERKSLAEQITTNPLYAEVLDGMEVSAIEQLVHAAPENTARAQERVLAIRNLRQDLEQALSTPTRRSAPA